jgi:hypothetical protein
MDADELITRPKPTWYNNYYFRSKLEAKWAVFFDLMKIKWEYEPEPFTCDDGSQYTPDFYLPKTYLRNTKGVYVEIKPEGFNELGYNQRIASSLKNSQLIVLYGDPIRAIIDVHTRNNSNEQLCPWWDDYMVFMYCDSCNTSKFEFNEGNYYFCPVCKSPTEITSTAISHAAEVARNFRFQFYDPRNK